MSESVHAVAMSKPESSPPVKLQPPPGTYVVRVPKEQIYRYAMPENAYKIKKLRKHRRRRCRCCLYCLLSLMAFLALALAIASGVLYFAFRPKWPKYSVESLSARGFNLSSPGSLRLSPEFDVTIRAENPNEKIEIYYLGGGSMTVSYADVPLCNAVLPEFYQMKRDMTVFKTALTGQEIILSESLVRTLMARQQRGEIPLELDLELPVKLKVGTVKTWTLTVDVGCDLTVDRLEEDSKIVSNICKVKVGPLIAV